jgi:hypothetical protein
LLKQRKFKNLKKLLKQRKFKNLKKQLKKKKPKKKIMISMMKKRKSNDGN